MRTCCPRSSPIVAASGGEAEYAEFWERFRAARTPQEEQRYLFALAGFRHPELVRRTLGHTIDGEVRSQDAPFLMRALLGSVHGRELAWEFLKEHWETMARVYPGSAYRRVYEGITALVSPQWEREVQEFFRRAESSSAARRSSNTSSSSGWPCGSRSGSRRRSGRTSVGRGADRSAEASAHPALSAARAARAGTSPDIAHALSPAPRALAGSRGCRAR